VLENKEMEKEWIDKCFEQLLEVEEWINPFVTEVIERLGIAYQVGEKITEARGHMQQQMLNCNTRCGEH
jgi:lipopolysaccharide biosynthesis regulator YciM